MLHNNKTSTLKTRPIGSISWILVAPLCKSNPVCYCAVHILGDVHAVRHAPLQFDSQMADHGQAAAVCKASASGQ